MAPAKKKTAPKQKNEMEELSFTRSEIGIVQEILGELDSKHKLSWSDDETVATGTTGTGGIIIFVGPADDTESSVFKFSMNEEGKKLYLAIKKREEERITESTVKDTVFETTGLATIRTGDGMRLGDNLSVLKDYDTFFKSVGIKKVFFSGVPGISRIESYVPEEPTIIFCPRNSFDTTISFNTSRYESQFRSFTGYHNNSYRICEPKEVSGETVVKLYFGPDEARDLVGKYYSGRNLILWYTNPFHRIDQSKSAHAWENTFLLEMHKVFIRELTKTKITKTDVNGFAMKIMVQEFSEAGHKRAREIQSKQTSLQKQVAEYETALLRDMTEFESNKQILDALTIVGEKSIENFTKEIELLKKVPLVTNVTLSDGKVNITFKPTTIKAPVVREVADTKDGDLYEMYIGSITAHISGDGGITVSCDTPCGSYSHPHVSGGAPCLGHGDGPNLMRKLIAEKKLSEFPYSFWMWIRRWRPEDCYVKPYTYIDDRLKKGLPVFNSKGERVQLNDPALMKKGVLIEMTKDTSYEANIAKFKDFKPQA